MQAMAFQEEAVLTLPQSREGRPMAHLPIWVGIEGKERHAMIGAVDSQAGASFIDAKMAEELGCVVDSERVLIELGADTGTKLWAEGCTDVMVTVGGEVRITRKIRMVVLKDKVGAPVTLGEDFLEHTCSFVGSRGMLWCDRTSGPGQCMFVPLLNQGEAEQWLKEATLVSIRSARQKERRWLFGRMEMAPEMDGQTQEEQIWKACKEPDKDQVCIPNEKDGTQKCCHGCAENAGEEKANGQQVLMDFSGVTASKPEHVDPDSVRGQYGGARSRRGRYGARGGAVAAARANTRCNLVRNQQMGTARDEAGRHFLVNTPTLSCSEELEMGRNSSKNTLPVGNRLPTMTSWSCSIL